VQELFVTFTREDPVRRYKIHQVKSLADISSESVTSLLRKLIAVPSRYFHEDKIAEFVRNWLQENDLEANEHRFHLQEPKKASGTNIIGSLKGTRPGPRVLLNGHYDTVELCQNWTEDPYQGSIKGGKLYGLGALDMKAGICAMMLALAKLNHLKSQLCGEIIYTFVAGEEGPFGLGTGALLKDERLNDIDLAIVPEPSSGFSKKSFPCLSLGARGGLSYTIELIGKSAHGANPELGLNAVSEASRLIVELEGAELIEDPELGKGSICVTEFKGGGEPLSVPDQAFVKVFRHTVRGESKQTVLDEVAAAAERAKLRCQYKITFREAPYPEVEEFKPYLTSYDNPHVQQFVKICEDTTQSSITQHRFSSVGDFNHLGGYLEIPTIVFGPYGENYHSADEWVDIESTTQTAEIIYKFLYQTFSQTPQTNKGD
jgi:acetylornithine deacetylase/succinyl-diaminopimelate desuccinylase-like protein